jgi:hypothetical protein
LISDVIHPGLIIADQFAILGMMKLWLDDLRPAPEDWYWVKSVDEAKTALESGDVLYASLDHDLGDPDAPTGYDFCLWMAEFDIWPTEVVTVHSANPVGAKRMCGVVDRYGPYEVRCQWRPALA